MKVSRGSIVFHSVTNSRPPTAIWTQKTTICCSADSVCDKLSRRFRSSWLPIQTWPKTWWIVCKSRYQVVRCNDNLIFVLSFLFLSFFYFRYFDFAFAVVADHKRFCRSKTYMQRVLWSRTRLGDVQKTEWRCAQGN